MIQHRPFGSEHPYATTYDQRVPASPSDAETVRLRVRAAPSVIGVECEWCQGPAGEPWRTELLPLTPEAPTADRGGATVDGHLAALQERGISADGAWGVEVGPVRAGVRYRYRFHAHADGGRQAAANAHRRGVAPGGSAARDRPAGPADPEGSAAAATTPAAAGRTGHGRAGPRTAGLDAECGNVDQLGQAVAEAFTQHPDHEIITAFLAWATSSGPGCWPRSATTGTGSPTLAR